MCEFRVISFYTVNTPYEQVMNKYLVPSLKRHPKLEYDIIPVEPVGNWTRNVALKPTVIAQELAKDPRDLVWLDADCIVKRYPQLLHEIPEESDLGLFYLDWEKWYRKKGSSRIELVSSCMFLRNTEKVRDLVDEWAKRALESHEWEQKVLQELLEEREMSIFTFPEGFNYINTLPTGKAPYPENVVEDPYIVQIQISRDLKK